jgi:endonuclease YncB( thermonuclease family)
MIWLVISTQNLIFALLILCCSSSVSADSITGRVVNISDGDTLTLVAANQSRKTIRLAGIDAPEKLQDFGPQAKQQLTALCLDKPAQVEVRTIDRYGRSVARVSCDDVDVASVMLEKGMAWHFTRYASSQPAQEAESDKAAQTRAKNDRIGLWVAPEPVAPWGWRAKQRDLK